ncbi:GNAT family N-acetyltransferase [Flavobacteriales bacterium]|nr:GNAT family N-acetyltransferase [Flavobacteriales bacterium]
MLKEKEILLRTLESTDLDFLLNLENDRTLWKVSGTTKPFSEKEISNYISNAKQDIAISEQFRFVIDMHGIAVGCIDLYEYNWVKQRAGVGIVILKKYRRRGFAKQALVSLIKYAWNELRLKQLYAGILSDNTSSLFLFKSAGFQQVRKNNYVLNR